MSAATPAPRSSSFASYVSLLEMHPELLAAHLPKGPDSAALVARYPDLAAVDMREITIRGQHGDLPARHYRGPDTSAGPALVWVHGGAYVGGDLDMPEANWVALTLAARGIPVLCVDYHKCLHGVCFPVPSDDVLAAWLWAVQHADELGATPAELHLGGASAGANLAAGVTKRLRDDAGPAPASLLLVYPIVHPQLPPLSDPLRAATAQLTGTAVTGDMVEEFNLQFAGTADVLADPYAFAGNGDISGQPPVYVLNADADYLRASGEAYAAQLDLAGVSVTVEFEPSAEHGHLNAPFQTPGERSLERIVCWLRGRARTEVTRM
ncbi:MULTISPECIES: alpha/beta hydrolase fold domain-containing protein [unclassified Frankia]|uniref:alpha/beta hydrolase fold domain-containing protein n=1 Tax=unclassified Frankia TaxID=2632575 RepID=UPI0027DD94E1|nr:MULTISPECIES: alpha/beta hydrolase fold domain-containing protein [unclassified Frankia]